MSTPRQRSPLRAASFAVAAALMASVLGVSPAAAQTGGAPAHAPAQIDFKSEAASQDARQMAQWILDAGNNHNLSFMIVDKKEAKVFMFDPGGRLLGASAVLLGAAIGDDSAPGIGERKLSSILPGERTTPAGRFVAALDHNIGGKDILWIDYANAISLHRVVTGNAQERRTQRLASSPTSDNRISYGCINVPPKFFDKVVMPAFHQTNGIVYILPETRPIAAVFAGFGSR
ncbi:hypothetical protein [Massilia sp. TSP1-1-2]|uniref:hypothetical protein n=1 Tax=unclassified Massilia TaxID=2609279 RepID=UPI003CE85169